MSPYILSFKQNINAEGYRFKQKNVKMCFPNEKSLCHLGQGKEFLVSTPKIHA